MWRDRGLTMVLVTHDSTVARRAQRIGVMKNGRLNFKQPARAKTLRTQPSASAPPDLAPPDLAPPDLAPSASAPSASAPPDLPPTTDSISFPN
jgi:ABC-type multidrug transport system ATPase subunit